MNKFTVDTEEDMTSIPLNELPHVHHNEFWMTNLPPPIRQLPIMYLCIPGSAGSASYSVSLDPRERRQETNITQQLKNGIRYISAVVYWNAEIETWVCDSYVALIDILRQLNIFAILHSDEVILFEVTCRDKTANHIPFVMQHIKHLMFEQPDDGVWQSRYSIDRICKTGQNVVFMNNQYGNLPNVFYTNLKHLTTDSVDDLYRYLPLATEINIFKSLTLPPYLVDVRWSTLGNNESWIRCLSPCCYAPADDNDIDDKIKMSHDTLIKFVHSQNAQTCLEKVFILSVDYESRINLVELCLHLLKVRFFC